MKKQQKNLEKKITKNYKQEAFTNKPTETDGKSSKRTQSKKKKNEKLGNYKENRKLSYSLHHSKSLI